MSIHDHHGRRRWHPRSALVLAGLGAGLLASPTLAASATATGAPVFASVAQIESLAAAVKHPVYWLGPRSGFNYELTVLQSGKVYIRYLPKGVKLADKRPIFKTVATYPVKDALTNLRAGAKFLKRPVFKVGKNGSAVVSRPPTSVYVVFGTTDYQVEVFTPSAKLSKAALKSLRPVG